MSSGRDRSRQIRRRKKEEKRKQKRREKAHPVGSQPPASSVHAGAQRTSFVREYVSPAALASLGPILVGKWLVPEALELALVDAGRPVPEPVAGYLLIDT